jgi:hypothetical protein
VTEGLLGAVCPRRDVQLRVRPDRWLASARCGRSTWRSPHGDGSKHPGAAVVDGTGSIRANSRRQGAAIQTRATRRRAGAIAASGLSAGVTTIGRDRQLVTSDTRGSGPADRPRGGPPMDTRTSDHSGSAPSLSMIDETPVGRQSAKEREGGRRGPGGHGKGKTNGAARIPTGRGGGPRGDRNPDNEPRGFARAPSITL